MFIGSSKYFFTNSLVLKLINKGVCVYFLFSFVFLFSFSYRLQNQIVHKAFMQVAFTERISTPKVIITQEQMFTFLYLPKGLVI